LDQLEKACLCLSVGLRFAGFFFAHGFGPYRFGFGRENDVKRTEIETMGMRIKKQRLALGMTQDALAEKMNIPKVSVSAYENDRVDIKASTILELSKNLNLTPNAILLGDQIYGEKDNDAWLENVISMLGKIKDPTARKLIAVEIEALMTKV